MKPTSLSHEFYENLYNEIISSEGHDECTSDNGTVRKSYEIDIDEYSISVHATFEQAFVDDSFDHAFGTEYEYHFEDGDLQEIEVECLFRNNDDGSETEITDEFDYKAFYNAMRG